MQALDFMNAIAERELSSVARALALLWWSGRDDPTHGMTAKEICSLIEATGHPKQNASRLHRTLQEDWRATKAGGMAWRLHPKARAELEKEYAPFRTSQPKPRATDSVLPRDVFIGTRGYIEKVVFQINASYDATLYDCCAVMCRRLLETLLIETYEHAGRASEIKGPDGNFFMFAGLLGHFEKDAQFNVGRNGMKGLRDFKALGDQSAHNRRFNARQSDIDRIRDGLRVAAEELLHLSGLAAGDS